MSAPFLLRAETQKSRRTDPGSAAPQARKRRQTSLAAFFAVFSFVASGFAKRRRSRRGKQEDDHKNDDCQKDQASASAAVAASAASAAVRAASTAASAVMAASAAGFAEAPVKCLLVMRIAGCAFSEIAIIVRHKKLLSVKCACVSSRLFAHGYSCFRSFFEQEAVAYIICPALSKVNTAGMPHFAFLRVSCKKAGQNAENRLILFAAVLK
jgi:hypothetical protein